jgi:hypothetical protein
MARLDHPAVQTVYINLPEEPQAGAKLHQAMQYGGGYFQIKAKRDANSTTSWNTSLAYHIEFSEWQHGPLAVTSCGRRAEGKASGKLYISFKGSGMGVANSWLAGVFNDAPVLYCAADQ